MKQVTTFDHVFHLWMQEELKPHKERDVLKFVQKKKGYNSITEWRLAAALSMGLDKLSWKIMHIKNPNKELPRVIIGPYQGWSQFFTNRLTTRFEDALRIPEFIAWCKTHDRINPIMKNFPTSSTIILLQKENGDLIHIEGGHRICALTYAQVLGKPISFGKEKTIYACIAKVTNPQIALLKKYLKQGSHKKPLK